MIKKLLLFTALNVLLLNGYAQYCGNSGSFQCTASNLSLPWLTPPPDSLAPFVNGQPSTTVIQFKNFNTVFFGGSYYTVNSLRIDTVDNLPAGLCWASDKANNTYANQESGCLKINGVPCSATGQYKMRIKVSVDLGFGIAQVDADQAGLKYYIRLKNNGDADTQIDSNQTAANPFIPYGGVCAALPLNAYLGTDQTVCSGSIATLNPTISGGQAPFTYAWGATANSLSCVNCANPTVTLTQNSTFTVTVTDANNATSTDVISYNVTGAGNNYQINAAGATTFCQNNSVLLGGTSASGFSYQWLLNNVNVTGANATSITAASSGNYVLVFSGNGCYATSNIITVNVLASPDASIIAQPASACEGDTIHLMAQTDTSVHLFIWLLNGVSTNDSALTTNALTNGIYTLIVRNSSSCYDTSSKNVFFKPLPQVTLSGNPDAICNNSGSFTLTGGSPAGGTYSGAGITGNSFNPTSAGAGTHVVTYTYTDTTYFCSNTATENILVNSCTVVEDLNEASLITLYPNPVNDLLTIESPLFDNSNLSVTVFDVTGKQQTINYKLQAGRVTLRTDVLSAGSYWIRVNANGKELSRKFVKVD